MVKFEFTVSDADAENIFACIRDQANRRNEQILDLMAKGLGKEAPEVQWLVADKEYLLGLMSKMTNTQVSL